MPALFWAPISIKAKVHTVNGLGRLCAPAHTHTHTLKCNEYPIVWSYTVHCSMGKVGCDARCGIFYDTFCI